MNLNEEQTKRYEEMAEEHVEFLYERIFKPAFKMAFLHGAKHMYEEIMQGPGYTAEIQFNPTPPNWTCPKCKKTYDDNTLACPECQSLNPNAFVDDDPDDDKEEPPSDPTEDAMEKAEEIRHHGHLGASPLYKRREMGFETRLKKEQAAKQEVLRNPIDWTNSQIGNIARNILHSFGVRTYKDLCRWSKTDLLNLKGIGKISVEQIEDYLAKFDLKLR